MKPIDSRLFRHAAAARFFIAASVLIGLATAVLVVVQAVLIASLLVGTFLEHKGIAEQRASLVALGAVLAARVLLAYGSELSAYQAAAKVRSQLRRSFLTGAARRGPSWLAGQPTGELTLLATRGLDATDAYFARYLPQLVLACVVPFVLGVRVLTDDLTSAVIIACTLPLIPVFMVLIGLGTQAQMDRQWSTFSRLSHHFLDVVTGLPTLKMFRREAAQVATIRRVSNELRRTTMRTLRVAFLSSMALELLASLSVALIAVSIGVRLVDGSLTLRVGLTVLLLAPEVYLPWRRVGAAYHASVEGVSAVAKALDVVESTANPPSVTVDSRGPAPDLRRAAIRFDRVRVEYPGRPLAALDEFSLTIGPGEVVAVVGPSGCGKSTLLSVLLRFVDPVAGGVLVDGLDLADLDVGQWRRQLAWVGQRPRLFAASVADNIRLGAPSASDDAVARAATAVAASDFIEALPDGFHTLVGEGGVGLSVGQAQRIAIARAFLRDAPLLLLDEPTSALDADTERQVSDALLTVMRDRTVVLTSHRPALFTRAGRVVRLPDPSERAESAA